MTRRMFRSQTVILIGLVLFFGACEQKTNPEPELPECNPAGPGELLSASFIMSYTPEQIQPYLSLLGLQGFSLSYAVDAYKLSYRSRDAEAELTPASGVMFIPRGLDTLDLVSVQHGTVIKRDEVGSVQPFYAIDVLLTAMNGYLTISPDYLGLGDSPLLHPYLHAALSAQPVVDMIRALRAYACAEGLVLSDNLFLAGYSEGGYVTLASQRIMETDHAGEFTLTAVAPMAGPYDLLWTTQDMLGRQSYDNPAYLAYLTHAYNQIYGWNRLDEIFQEPYASRVQELYTGSFDAEYINAQLSKDLSSLFQADFRAGFLAGTETELQSALLENSIRDWGPIAPVRLIHGLADSTVAAENSYRVRDSMLANGALSVDLITLPGADHATAAFPAYFIAIQWFDSLRLAD